MSITDLRARLDHLPDMESRLWDLLDQVPPGSTATYGAVAEALGSRAAARWIGHVCLHHNHTDDCPCHRLVCADGRLGHFICGGTAAKARLLRREGIDVRDDRIPLGQYGFNQFSGPQPLAELRAWQEQLLAHQRLSPRGRLPQTVGGVDVAYLADGTGAAAYSLVDFATAKCLWTTVLRRPVKFPYISSFLTFRELPILLALLDEITRQGRLAEVLMVDGSGILHPRQAGIATSLGIVAQLPTIGVTKKKLVGRVDRQSLSSGESCPIRDNAGGVLGTAVRSASGHARCVFVSPGYGVDVAFADRVVRHLFTTRRLPEPVYWADRMARTEARAAQRGHPSAAVIQSTPRTRRRPTGRRP